MRHALSFKESLVLKLDKAWLRVHMLTVRLDKCGSWSWMGVPASTIKQQTFPARCAGNRLWMLLSAPLQLNLQQRA